MKVFRLIGGVLLCTVVQVTPALAAPTMIRLGYADCAACHVSPQGGGLLTSYGRGVDVAQSARARELPPSDADTRRYLYDVRFVAVGQDARALASHTSTVSSTFQVQLRNSLRLGDHNRLTYTLGLSGQTLPTSSTQSGGSAQLIVPKAIWEFRPKDGIELSVGREELPTGVGLPDPQAYMRKGTDPGNTVYPTQIKAFIYTHRLQLAPFVFGPGGDEDPRLQQWGVGTLAGVNVWKQRAVVGVSLLDSQSPAFDRRSVGAYARLGFGRWGILTQHEMTGRSSIAASPVTTQYLAGHTQLFLAAKEWLVTSLGAEELVVDGTSNSRAYRVAPGVQLRASENLTVSFTMRDVFAGVSTGRSRTFSVLVAVKTVD
jgi:hypothetical protein